MRMLLTLLALAAVPAQAQDSSLYHASDTWPVHTSGGACTMSQADGGGLSVGYDRRSGEVTLTTTNEVAATLPSTGSIDMIVVFLDNGAEKYDDAWGARRFDYVREDDTARFTARFAGEKNVRQILADLSNSSAVGFRYGDEPVLGYDLAGARPSLARLRECADRAVAAN